MRVVTIIAICLATILAGCGQTSDLSNLATLTPGRTAAQNALWIENPASARFNSSRTVVVADIPGPAVITMIHFALPQLSVDKPKEYTLGRDLILRMYWDGEPAPSVDCPLVDFFCDPAGERESVNTALVNKRRGFNAYFPMPFRKSARIELIYEGPVEPGDKLWSMMPCYSYVMYRTLDKVGEDEGYFHAQWRQELLPLGQRDYTALEAVGRGKFVGWNVTSRLPGRPGYPVDENEKFYIDGATEPAIEFQGLEDSFGFSWGFPPTENLFALTGFFPFRQDGATAYRFFVGDAISFTKSLKVTIGFGKNENPFFRKHFSTEANSLEFASTVYWYQTEPHAAFPKMPAAKDRAPCEYDVKAHEQLPTAEELRKRGVKLHMRCGRPEKEIIFAENGYGAEVKKGYSYDGWPAPNYHCRGDDQNIDIELTVPKGTSGLVRLFMIDPDQFQGGRREEVFVAGQSIGVVTDFTEGKWLQHLVRADQTGSGKVPIRITNANKESNAAISIIEWVEGSK